VTGLVSLVGAGPWDPELLTLAGRERLSRADVVIADYLVNPAHLMHCRPEARIYQRQAGPHASLLDQAAVNDLMVEHALAGRYVVRLKGGDPMIFGRGCEEAQHLRAHGVDFEFIPGVSAAIAAPEAAGIPVTHRDHTPSVSFVSGYEAYDKGGLAVAWDHLAQSAGTLVLMMGVRNARDNTARLIAAGRPASTPAALIRWGTRGIQRTLVGTLGDIADLAEKSGLRAPAVLVVGSVVDPPPRDPVVRAPPPLRPPRRRHPRRPPERRAARPPRRRRRRRRRDPLPRPRPARRPRRRPRRRPPPRSSRRPHPLEPQRRARLF
jgi:uroporphyrinogen III methyltransferase/synthase